MADPTKAASTSTTVGAPPPFQITPIRQQHRFIKCLFYAQFGYGKTTLAGSSVDVPKMRDVLFVNAESGTMSVEESDRIKHVDLIDVVRVTDFKQVAHVQEFLKAHIIARDAYLRNGPGPDKDAALTRLAKLQSRMFGTEYMPLDVIDDDCKEDVRDPTTGVWSAARLRLFRTVIVDSLTEIDTLSMYGLLNIQTDMKLDMEKMDVAQFAEFRKNNQMLQLLVRAYRDLDMNVILVCSAQYNQDELKRMHWAPAVTGKLAAQIQGFVDIVGYMQVGKPTAEGGKEAPRRLYIQPIGQFDAKSRIASFKDPYIDDPSMSKIMAAFDGQKGAPKAAAKG